MMTATPYQSLVAAAAELVDIDVLADIDEGDISAASEVLRDRGALEAARSALGPQCVVPLRFEQSFFAEHWEDVRRLRNLARALRAEAFLAASNADYHSAAKIGIDILELANTVRRGGLVTDLLVGIAISGIGIEALCKIRTRFDRPARRLLIEQLPRLEAEREPFADVVARDDEWEAAVGSPDEPYEFPPMELSDPEECGLSEEEQLAVFQFVQDLVQDIADLPEAEWRRMQLDQDRQILALMRMLVIDCALRDWHEISGAFPDDLSSLSPRWLPKHPLDPYTEASFIYRRAGDAFHLYSTGPKLHDGGGQFGPWPSVAAGCADLCLDADDYWLDCCTFRQRQGVARRIASAIRAWWHARR